MTPQLLNELLSMDADGNGDIDRMEFSMFYLVKTSRVTAYVSVELRAVALCTQSKMKCTRERSYYVGNQVTDLRHGSW